MDIVCLGLDGLNESGAAIAMTPILSWVAVAQSLDGKMPEALATIEKALQVNPVELAWRPEAIRIRGELRLKSRQTDAAAGDFRDAIALAQKIGARAWELRARTSLVRLLDKQVHRDEARAMMAEIYNWFTEGFDTPDLKDAEALLEELKA
jgi:tetratricopeptide (TPR) repeat protein